MDMFGIDTMGPDERRELVRRNIQNLITSYADDGDVFTELIQNAIDAINLRQDKEPSAVGDLVIMIGRRSENAHYVYVQDNGLGMSDETATRMFIPAFSSGKKAGATVGHKGVGVSFVVGVSNMLALRTIDGSGAVTERTIRHTHEWVTDSEKPSPAVVAEFDAPPAVKLLADAIERGTGVYFEFHAGHEPTSLDNIVRIGDGPQKEIDHWAAFLCARTPLGLARPIGTSAPDPALAVQIFLDLGDGNPLNKMYHRSDFDLGATPPTLGYPFPEAVFKVGMDTEKIDATAPAQLRNHDRKYAAVYREWTGDELDEFLDGLDDEYRELLAVHLDWVRGYFAYSTDVLGEIRQIMGTQRRVVRYGARLVVDSVPQGHPVDLALTSNQGLERQTHIVVGLKNVQLDTGRKFVSDETTRAAIDKVTQRVVNYFKNYRWAMKIKDRVPIGDDLGTWISSIDGRTGDSFLPALFSALAKTPAAVVDPDNEQEVISLWTALLARDQLPGYEMIAISGFNRYDALVHIREEAVATDGPLGLVSGSTATPLKDHAVLEFKLDFASLIDDLETGVKLAHEMDVVVCWDCPELNLARGTLTPVYGPTWNHGRPARGVSYVWRDDNNGPEIMVIALRVVIAELLKELDPGLGSALLNLLVNRDSQKLI